MKKTVLITAALGLVFIIVGIAGIAIQGGGNAWEGTSFLNNKGAVSSGEKLDLETLKESVDKYIANYSEDLEIIEVVMYEDSDYYVSVRESKTGKGAMELLVNPYSGEVYPEFGPNMMWNLKYGMMRSGLNGHGMMGSFRGRGMMRSYDENTYNKDAYNNNDNNVYNNNYNEVNDITLDEAYTITNEYIASHLSESTVVEEAYEFYGYYTFHLEKDNQMTGMLSVNGFTGDVWYHDWHGQASEHK